MELDNIKRTWAEINLDALCSNFENIRRQASGAKICAVVKADGYGHGAKKLSQLYSELGVDYFAVSNIDEALELRECGIAEPILVLGFTPVKLAVTLSENNIAQAVYGLEYAYALSDACVKAGCSIDVHIKVDTGMSRIGFMCQSFPRDNDSIDEIIEACNMQGLNPVGIMAHFSVSDEGEAGKEYTIKQLENFNHTVSELEGRGVSFEYIHHANSGGIGFYPNSHLNMVRAGIILYGLEPNPAIPSQLSLKPAMTLKSKIAFVKKLSKGSCVSYGRTFTAPRDMVVATVPIGYADGYFRSISSEGYMSVKGKKAKILGRICMDQTIIDVTDIEDVKIGDDAIIFSDGSDSAPTASDLAEFAGTINYEIVCAVSKRVPRVYRKDNKTVDVMYKL